MVTGPPRIPGRRWTIGVLLGAGVLVNYIDRISLSVAAPQLQQEFNLSPEELGLLFSAFFWSYSLAPAARRPCCSTGSASRPSAAGAPFCGPWPRRSPPLSSGFAGIFAARLLLGIAEAPGMIGNQKATGYWFPDQRAQPLDRDFRFRGQILQCHRRAAGRLLHRQFRLALGLRHHRDAELRLFHRLLADLSRPQRGQAAQQDRTRLYPCRRRHAGRHRRSGQGKMLGYVLRNRKVWGLTIGYSAYGYSFYLFLTWLPGYLVQTLHMSILKSAGFSTIPWMFATLADLLIGGFLVDHLIARGHDETKVRKSVMVAGMLLGLAVFGAACTTRSVLGADLDHHRSVRSFRRGAGGLLDRLADQLRAAAPPRSAASST